MVLMDPEKDAPEDYPGNLIEFETRFVTEQACRQYLERLRWPQGFVCPNCRSSQAWRVQRGNLWFCATCRRQTSVTAGTIFEGTRKPLRGCTNNNLRFSFFFFQKGQFSAYTARVHQQPIPNFLSLNPCVTTFDRLPRQAFCVV